MLKVQSLECIRDDRLLFSGLSFVVAEGDVVQIEGKNGSGKTSLLRNICGLRLPDAGEISWQGESITANREDYYANMVYIGHLPCVKADLTVLENVRALLDTRSLSQSNTVIEQALIKVGLESYDDVAAKALSSGQRRRILLAFVALAQAKLWILDEPLTALDVDGVALMESMIIAHQKNGGCVIFTTHHGMQLHCPMTSIELGRSVKPSAPSYYV